MQCTQTAVKSRHHLNYLF